jgi:hypothetical protein
MKWHMCVGPEPELMLALVHHLQSLLNYPDLLDLFQLQEITPKLLIKDIAMFLFKTKTLLQVGKPMHVRYNTYPCVCVCVCVCEM